MKPKHINKIANKSRNEFSGHTANQTNIPWVVQWGEILSGKLWEGVTQWFGENDFD